MKKYKVLIRTEVEGSECEDFFEVDENATTEEVEDEAKEIAMNMIEWHYEVV